MTSAEVFVLAVMRWGFICQGGTWNRKCQAHASMLHTYQKNGGSSVSLLREQAFLLLLVCREVCEVPPVSHHVSQIKISTVQSSRRNICNRLMRDCGTELVSEEMRWLRQLMNLTLRCYYCLFLHCAGALCSCLHSPARTTCWHSVASAIPPNNSARHLKHILSVSSVSYDTSQLIS